MAKPVVIIRTLEDSPESLDQTLLVAYLRTRYWVEWPDNNRDFLTIGAPFHSAFASNLAIITAYNPHSIMQDEQENARRNAELYQELTTRPFRILSAKNEGSDDTWPPEPGFCMLDIPFWEAVYIGRKFNQNALVWADQQGVALVFL